MAGSGLSDRTRQNALEAGAGLVGFTPAARLPEHAESIERMRDQPVKAYVVADDVTSAQAYQRRIARNRVV